MLGVVIAGGASRRFGGQPKGLVSLASRPMALRVADVLRQVCERVIIEAPQGLGYEDLGMQLVHAHPGHAGKGPLAGILTGLNAAEESDRVAFAPCDMPLLTKEVYGALANAYWNERPPGVYATSHLGVEPLVSLLSTDLRPTLVKALNRPKLPPTHAVLDAAGVRTVAFADSAPFTNVNTRDELLLLDRAWSK